MKRVIVTRESLNTLINRGDSVALRAIGRALVLLFKRQTFDEREHGDTKYHNGIGFTPADAHSGALTAKFYIKHNNLLDWQVAMWTKPNAKGWSRLSKYHAQLNEEAKAKERKML